jgi:hypothetical protein
MSDEEVKEGEVVSAKLKGIQLPPDNVIGSAFLSAIKYHSIASAMSAYNSVIRAESEIEESTAELYRARVDKMSAIQLLEDAPKIHAEESRVRMAKFRAERIRAEQHEKQEKHEAYLAKLQREVEKRNARVMHAKLMGESGEEETDNLTDAEEELKEYLKDKLRPSRYKTVADDLKSEMNLSKEQEKMLDELVEELTKAED